MYNLCRLVPTCAVLHGSATDEAVVSAAGGAVVSIAVAVVLAGVVVGFVC